MLVTYRDGGPLYGTYYFLEVNVVGQYLLQSINCNYKIEKIIAEWLLKNDCNGN